MSLFKRSREPYAVTLRTAAKLPVDHRLIERQEQKARELGPNSIKPLLVEDQPDTFVAPRPFDDEFLFSVPPHASKVPF